MDLSKSKKKSLLEKKYSPEVCNIDVWGDPEIIKTTGSSMSFSAIVKLELSPNEILKRTSNKKAFIKAYPQPFHTQKAGYEDNAFAREIIVLRYLSYFLKYNITPCVQKYIADFVCKPRKKWDEPIENLFEKNELYKDEEEQYRENPRIHFLLTEMIEGYLLTYWIDKKKTIEQVKSILFQVLYTAWQFYLGGIRHNDLHPMNIIVTKGPGKTLYFGTCGKVVKVNGDYIAKIIDYDRAGFFGGDPPNIIWSSICEDYGACPDGENRTADALRFINWLCALKNNMSPECIQYLTDFTNKISPEPDELFTQKLTKYMTRYVGIPCNVPKNSGDCQNWEIPTKILATFPEMMAKNLFGVECALKEELNESEHVYCGIELDAKLRSFLGQTRKVAFSQEK